MVVKLMKPLFTGSAMVKRKDGRTFSGQLLQPGYYPNWPKEKAVPKSAKVLKAMPSRIKIAESADEVHEIDWEGSDQPEEVLPHPSTEKPVGAGKGA